jgi:hypothetical protein
MGNGGDRRAEVEELSRQHRLPAEGEEMLAARTG